MQVNINTIKDVLNDNGALYTYNQFIDKFGECISWLNYYSLVTAIPLEWMELMVTKDNQYIASLDLHDQLKGYVSVTNITYTKYITKRNILQIYCDRWHHQGIDIEEEKLRTKLLEV